MPRMPHQALKVIVDATRDLEIAEKRFRNPRSDADDEDELSVFDTDDETTIRQEAVIDALWTISRVSKALGDLMTFWGNRVRDIDY